MEMAHPDYILRFIDNPSKAQIEKKTISIVEIFFRF
jgi:hypothetical protein